MKSHLGNWFQICIIKVTSRHRQVYSTDLSSTDSIPFSLVVAAQRRSPRQFSGTTLHHQPFLNFTALLSNLTRTARQVRMIPIAVSSQEAAIIRSCTD